ncbi:hypothetical protein ACFVXG_20480 [Kitasatospora sp. NPDC058162]|uniref:hypothetical protein n=1 Tax=Kitasatospora sp. NPDC058162 TaxID=3346362 RepID=UPI0036DA15D4
MNAYHRHDRLYPSVMHYSTGQRIQILLELASTALSTRSSAQADLQRGPKGLTDDDWCERQDREARAERQVDEYAERIAHLYGYTPRDGACEECAAVEAEFPTAELVRGRMEDASAALRTWEASRVDLTARPVGMTGDEWRRIRVRAIQDEAMVEDQADKIAALFGYGPRDGAR